MPITPSPGSVKIALGTAQLGLDYGISNQSGRTPDEEASEILRCAAEAGVRVLDTAPGYGESEAVVGRRRPASARFDIVTKTCEHVPGDTPEACAARLERTFRQSLSRLEVDRLYALLEHRPEELGGACATARARVLRGLREEGVVSKLGVSIYRATQLEAIPQRIAHEIELGVVQAPVNVFDQRLLATGVLQQLHERGVEVHARSAFLQGLLLMAPDSLPSALAPLREPLRRFRERARELSLTPLQAALGFVLAQSAVAVVICGVTTRRELEEILEASRVAVDPVDFNDLAVEDEALIDPSAWPSRNE